MGYEYDAAEAARYAELHPDARFVLAEDYDRLAAENATLTAMLDRLREVVPPCLPLEVSQLAFGHLCTVQDILYPAPETTDEDK